ncbi:uncharacterized protein LOC121521076 isoform X2 [Cheilinus undulatus]|uniref:uncharacterized protein LOC121521076 isoform X2 n=1 Tax=Cheilinus undulatus TaxID=241271 RepID=UPI001BD341AD|nr:uncharacterized protein LOC121521076 isoform X2 [Cheilinus undulatus]
MLLFWILLLLLTAPSAVTGDNTASITVRVGEDVTLPCGNVIKNQLNCNSTSWLYSSGLSVTAEELITHGNISKSNKIAKAKSERLRVKEDCSLVIKHVTREDVGRYACRQFTPGEQASDAFVFLSMITIDTDSASRFYCNVVGYGDCEHTIQWYYTGDDHEISVTHYTCSATVAFSTTAERSDYDQLFCNVTDKKSRQTLQCDAISESCQKSESNGDRSSETEGNIPPPYPETPDWLPFVVAAVGLAAFVVFMLVVIIRRKKSQGNEIQRKNKAEQSLDPAVTQPGPVTGQEKEDPEDVVAYASISYTKQGNGKAWVGGDDDDGAVTYSTVKASSPHNEASVDPSSLYATVNKSNKKATS